MYMCLSHFSFTAVAYFLSIPQDKSFNDPTETKNRLDKLVTQIIKMGHPNDERALLEARLEAALQGLRDAYFRAKFQSFTYAPDQDPDPEEVFDETASAEERERQENAFMTRLTNEYRELKRREPNTKVTLQEYVHNATKAKDPPGTDQYKREIQADLHKFRRMAMSGLDGSVGAHIKTIIGCLSRKPADAPGRAMMDDLLKLLIKIRSETVENDQMGDLHSEWLDTTTHKRGSYVHNVRHLISDGGVFSHQDNLNLFRALEEKLLAHILKQLDSEDDKLDGLKKTLDFDLYIVGDIVLLFGEVQSSEKDLAVEVASLNAMAAKVLSVSPVAVGILVTNDRRIVIHRYARHDNAKKIGIRRFTFQFLPLDENLYEPRKQILRLAVNLQNMFEVLFKYIEIHNGKKEVLRYIATHLTRKAEDGRPNYWPPDGLQRDNPSCKYDADVQRELRLNSIFPLQVTPRGLPLEFLEKNKDWITARSKHQTDKPSCLNHYFPRETFKSYMKYREELYDEWTQDAQLSKMNVFAEKFWKPILKAKSIEKKRLQNNEELTGEEKKYVQLAKSLQEMPRTYEKPSLQFENKRDVREYGEQSEDNRNQLVKAMVNAQMRLKGYDSIIDAALLDPDNMSRVVEYHPSMYNERHILPAKEQKPLTYNLRETVPDSNYDPHQMPNVTPVASLRSPSSASGSALSLRSLLTSSPRATTLDNLVQAAAEWGGYGCSGAMQRVINHGGNSIYIDDQLMMKNDLESAARPFDYYPDLSPPPSQPSSKRRRTDEPIMREVAARN